ncbi:MAG: substrate-binding domain-containing protein [Clostridia bacterium]
MFFKILTSLILTATFAGIGYFLSEVSRFGGGRAFYTPLIIALTIFLLIFINLIIFKAFNWIVKIAFLLVGLLIFTGIVLNHENEMTIYRNTATLSDQSIDLEQYIPFDYKTKAVKLKAPSQLKFKENLPRLDGAVELFPVYSAFAQAVYPKKKYDIHGSEVMCSDNDNAYESLILGDVDLIFAEKPTKAQLAMAKQYHVTLKLTPIGRKAFVFFVNAKNNVIGLTTQQAKDIYAGKLKNWKDVGGKEGNIRAFQRPQQSASQLFMKTWMEGTKLMTAPKEDVVKRRGGTISEVATYRNFAEAIGYSFRFYTTQMVKSKQVRLLKMDGVLPDDASIQTKKYPLSTQFYAVTAKVKNPNVTKLIRWILSAQGQALIQKTGYTPIK